MKPKLHDIVRSMDLSSIYCHNGILILSPSYNYLPVLKVFTESIRLILTARTDVQMVIFDNASTPDAQDYLRSLTIPRLTVVLQTENKGKANSLNPFARDVLHDGNLPRVLVSLDPDITFSLASFDRLVAAAEALEQVGMLAMRYAKNGCSPEAKLWFPARQLRGSDGQIYPVYVPFLCNVAGGILALRGAVVRDTLKYELYPNAAAGKVYYSDDGALHDRLRKAGFLNGYLGGTEAFHWKSGEICLV